MLKNLTRLRPVVLNLARPRQIVKTTLNLPGKSNQVDLGLCRLINVRYCHNEKSSSPNNTDTDSSNHENADAGEGETITEDDIKAHILAESLHFVETHGWSIDALAEGAKAVGYPGVAHGMFERAGGDLVHYFVAQCNKSLAERLAEEAKQRAEDPELPKRKVSQIIRDAIEMRLRMIIPYVKHWPQAMALTAVPSNTIEHFKNLSKLMDDIWFYAGDSSADMNWYSKRLTLLALYKSTEMHLIQDSSPDFEDTWKFLDNRMADLSSFSKSTSSLEAIATGFGDLTSAAFTVGRNVLGMNNTNR